MLESQPGKLTAIKRSLNREKSQELCMQGICYKLATACV